MAKYDNRVDEYIKRAVPFAQPILSHLRDLVHDACPGATETIKWNFPHFEYGGAILCSMAAFKKHCTFGFWKAALMSDPKGILEAIDKTAMGQLVQITDMSDLPPDKIIKGFTLQAIKLTDEGARLPGKNQSSPKDLVVPDYFLKAVRKNKAALKTFDSFSLSTKKDYITWVTEAKTELTREKRLAQAIEWMAEGKIRNWKYVR